MTIVEDSKLPIFIPSPRWYKNRQKISIGGGIKIGDIKFANFQHIMGVFIISIWLMLSVCSCTRNQNNSLIQKGKMVYLANCIACHNANPKISGAVGPEIFGASLELLKSRVREGKYPPGYKPKRTTSLMVPLPQLSDQDISDLHAYLNQ